MENFKLDVEDILSFNFICDFFSEFNTGVKNNTDTFSKYILFKFLFI